MVKAHTKETVSDIMAYLIAGASILTDIQHILSFLIVVMTFILTAVRFSKWIKGRKQDKRDKKNEQKN